MGGELRTKKHLDPLLVRCAHCCIPFITDPRNRGRTDLGCPFGCQGAHEKAESQRRSSAFRKTVSGRQKKADLNRKAYERRRRTLAPSPPQKQPEVVPPVPRFSPEFLVYLAQVLWLVYRTKVKPEAIGEHLEKFFRQRGMAMKSRSLYMTLNSRDGPQQHEF